MDTWIYIQDTKIYEFLYPWIISGYEVDTKWIKDGYNVDIYPWIFIGYI